MLWSHPILPQSLAVCALSLDGLTLVRGAASSRKRLYGTSKTEAPRRALDATGGRPAGAESTGRPDEVRVVCGLRHRWGNRVRDARPRGLSQSFGVYPALSLRA